MPVLDGNFEAFVTNLGKYNEGMLVGEWVKLPTTEEEMQKVFERIGIGKQDEFGQPYEEWFITDYECPIYGVPVSYTHLYKLCQEHGLLSPIYTHCRRNGCWFCPNASDSELLHMVTKHPDMFDRLIEWENEDNIFHRRMTRRETPSEVKARLLSKSQTGFSSPKGK